MAYKKYGISLAPEVAAQIEQRIDRAGDRSPVINRQLERYFSILERARRELRLILSDQELGLIVDALTGKSFQDTFSVYFVGLEVIEAINFDRLDHKHTVDNPALIEKMVALTDMQRVALVDAVHVWRNRQVKGEKPDYTDVLM